MRSRTCCEYRPLWRLFCHSMKKQRGIVLLGGALMLLVCPGMLLRDVELMGDVIPYNLSAELFSWAMVLGVMTGLLLLVLLISNHSHLFSRKMSDLYFALPVGREGLFLVRVGAPLLSAAAVMSLCWLSLLLVNSLGNVIPASGWLIGQLWLLSLLLLCLVAAFFSLLTVCAGSIFDLLLAIAVLTLGPPLLGFLAHGWFDQAALGLRSSSAEGALLLSPPGFALYLIGPLGSGQSLGAGMVLAAALQTAILFGLALLLFCRRRAEKAENGFAYGFVPVLILLLASCLGGYLLSAIFAYDSSGLHHWLLLTLGAVLTALALGAIFSRGFHTWRRSLLLGGLGAALMLATLLLSTLAGQQAMHRLPDPDSIRRIELQTAGETFVFTEDFQSVLSFHEAAIRELEQPGGESLDCGILLDQRLQLCYVMEDGSRLERSYRVWGREALQQRLELMCSPQWRGHHRFPGDTAAVYVTAGAVRPDATGALRADTEASTYATVPAATAQTLMDSYYDCLARRLDTVLDHCADCVHVSFVGVDAAGKDTAVILLRVPREGFEDFWAALAAVAQPQDDGT